MTISQKWPDFYAVCKLEYEGIVNHRLVFSQQEIQGIIGAEFSETWSFPSSFFFPCLRVYKIISL